MHINTNTHAHVRACAHTHMHSIESIYPTHTCMHAHIYIMKCIPIYSRHLAHTSHCTGAADPPSLMLHSFHPRTLNTLLAHHTLQELRTHHPYYTCMPTYTSQIPDMRTWLCCLIAFVLLSHREGECVASRRPSASVTPSATVSIIGRGASPPRPEVEILKSQPCSQFTW